MLELNSVLRDRYKIISHIARGGMGEVYLAEHIKHPDFKVAIKVLDDTRTQSQDEREVFRNEVIAGYRVSHANVVKIYEYFDESDLQAYAMEHLSNGDLLTHVEKHIPMPPIQAAEILKQAALGLSALHRSGTIHRDIKPENILFAQDGSVKITDFGVALIRGGRDCTSNRNILAGTPKYMAPEYVETGKCDHRADIYALGVIAYELCSGCSPFTSVSEDELLKERLDIRGNDLSEKIPEIPRELADLVTRLMARSLTERFYDVIDAAKILDRFLVANNAAVTINRPAVDTTWATTLASTTQTIAVKQSQPQQDKTNRRPWFVLEQLTALLSHK